LSEGPLSFGFSGGLVSSLFSFGSPLSLGFSGGLGFGFSLGFFLGCSLGLGFISSLARRFHSVDLSSNLSPGPSPDTSAIKLWAHDGERRLTSCPQPRNSR
jgi:hypothetical protein